jgi:hypothetical protein
MTRQSFGSAANVTSLFYKPNYSVDNFISDALFSYFIG